jgi:cobalt-zinc-cadmium efflux system protein
MHQHLHDGDKGRVLIWSLGLTVVFVAVEVSAGVVSGSLALLADAGHNFTDALALALAWFGVYFSRKPPDEVKTYGYHRAGVLAAFVNALVLVALSVYILVESWERWNAPQPVSETVMIVVAALGLLVNAVIMWGLRSERRHDVNIRSAWLHMFGDALGSAAIIAGAIAIHYTGLNRIDPLLSAFIGALIVWTARDVILETLNILLEGLPRGLRLDEVVGEMRKVEGVRGVHDLHIWSLGSQTHALSCHVLIEDMPPSESGAILERLNAILDASFRIEHTTIQFEHADCPGCPIPENSANHRH